MNGSDNYIPINVSADLLWGMLVKQVMTNSLRVANGEATILSLTKADVVAVCESLRTAVTA